jgi:hypothetical protein
MSRHYLCVVLAAAAVVPLSCNRAEKKAADKAAATALLQNEAAAMKRDGEKLDPSLGVKATWTIHSVQVQEQPGNDARPFTGVVVFRINSRVDEPMGPVESNFEKTFRYAYDAKMGKWLFQP